MTKKRKQEKKAFEDHMQRVEEIYGRAFQVDDGDYHSAVNDSRAVYHEDLAVIKERS